MNISYYIDDTDVTMDNRDISETILTYKDLPGIEFVVGVRFALEIVKNALENQHEELSVETTAFDILERALGAYDEDATAE